MAKLKLTIACDSYDYLQPLREGKVQPEGIDLNLMTVESGIRHERMYHYGEYDACEFSMCSYLVARGQGVEACAAEVTVRKCDGTIGLEHQTGIGGRLPAIAAQAGPIHLRTIDTNPLQRDEARQNEVLLIHDDFACDAVHGLRPEDLALQEAGLHVFE